MKRGLDIIAAISLLFLSCPLWLLTALAVLLESGRPVLFKQTRLGLHGQPFAMYKFRSMVKDAAARGGYSTAHNDPRITRLGRFIRRTSLDELPQLWNLLKGEMSFVGPRPDVPAQKTLYSEADWALRCSVRPGLTGLAQAKLRSTATPAQRLALDLQYVRESSFALDAKIFWWTLQRLGGKGAN